MAAVMQILIHLYRNYRKMFPQSPQDRRIDDIQAFIDVHYLQDLSLGDIADQFHLDKYYLAHTFREAIGYTVKQYILLKRISHAKNLLYYSDKDISLVAAESGFHSASNFIRAFKNVEQVTPLKFRKIHTGEWQ